jgi:hypothetical protein
MPASLGLKLAISFISSFFLVIAYISHGKLPRG